MIIKILEAFHKPAKVIDDKDMIVPIYLGKANIEKDNVTSKAHLDIYDNMLGDDTGDNISKKNPYYNELTALYWAWKNYNEIGNPDFIGLMHYRRHFIINNQIKENQIYVKLSDKYLEQIGCTKANIKKILKKYDFIVPKAQTPMRNVSVYDHYKNSHDILDLDKIIEIINDHYPEFKEPAKNYLKGKKAYYYNMFVFSKDTFFDYANWMFSILNAYEKRYGIIEKRMYITERLTGIYITYLEEYKQMKGYYAPVSLIKDEIEIPVVFATDENYVIQTYTAISSIIRYREEGSKYKFIIIVSPDISEKSKKAFKELEKKANFCRVELIEANEDFKNASININHISIPTYYRLKITEYLQKHKKCIYLDSDIIVKQDLRDLFDINMDGRYVAGVLAPGYSLLDDKERYCKVNLVPSMDSYINAGVLLMNLDLIRSDQIDKKFIELSKLSFESQDQDIINSACYGKIKLLPLKYNTMVSRLNILNVFSNDEITDARKGPVIIHYATKYKPWNDYGCIGAYLWWDEVRRTPFWGRFCEENSERIINKCFPLSNKNDFFEEENWRVIETLSDDIDEVFQNNRGWYFPYNRVNEGCKIVLYGAGDVGKDFKRQIDENQYCKIVLWVDKKYEIYQRASLHVEEPVKIMEEKFDYVVIANADKEIAKQIKTYLINLKIDENKIIWFDKI